MLLRVNVTQRRRKGVLLVVWRYWTVARLAAQRRSQRLYRSLFLVHEMARRAALTTAANATASATATAAGHRATATAAGHRQSGKQASAAAAASTSSATPVVKRQTVSAYDEMLLQSQQQSTSDASGGYSRVSVKLASPTAATAATAAAQQAISPAATTAAASAVALSQQQHSNSYSANSFAIGYSNGHSNGPSDAPAVLYVSGRPHVPPFPTARGLQWGRGATAAHSLKATRLNGKRPVTALTDWSIALCEPARERYQRKEVLAAVVNFTAYRRCAPLVSSTVCCILYSASGSSSSSGNELIV
jgi:hypothetical protein